MSDRSVTLWLVVGCALTAPLADGRAVAQSTSSTGSPIAAPRLTGKIVDSAGAPVPDVQLFWHALHSIDRKPVHFIEGRSEADGTFRLKAPTERLGYMGGRPYGHLWVIPPNHALQVCEARDFLVQEGKSATALTLKPSAPIKCQILGPDVRPRAGELVEPEVLRIDGKEYHVQPRLREVLGGVTDAEGQWVMERLDERTTMRVRVVSQTYGRQVQRWPVDLAGRDFNIRMAEAGSIEGQIQSDEPYRFEGVPVKVWSSVRRSRVEAPDRDVATPVYFDTGEATTLVDREGRFRIPVIAAGEVIVILMESPDSEWAIESRPSIQLKEGETGKISFKSTRKIGFEGKVELSDGSPAVGVRVEASSGRNWPIGNAVTDSEGKFRCQVCPGKVTTKAYLPMFAGIPVINRAVSASNDTLVGTGSTSTVAETMRLPRVVLVEADVVDQSGKAISNCTVDIWRPKETYHQLRADSKGRFRIYRSDHAGFKEYTVKVNGEPASILEHAGEPTLIRVEE